ncbi:MAG: hypothetical protein ACRC3Z_13330 [Phocaeicola sp.]
MENQTKSNIESNIENQPKSKMKMKMKNQTKSTINTKMENLLLRAASATLLHYCQQVTIQSTRQRRMTGQLIVLLVGMQGHSDARKEVARLQAKLAKEQMQLETTTETTKEATTGKTMKTLPKTTTKKRLDRAETKLFKTENSETRYNCILKCKISLKKAFLRFCSNWYTWSSPIVTVKGLCNAWESG